MLTLMGGLCCVGFINPIGIIAGVRKYRRNAVFLIKVRNYVSHAALHFIIIRLTLMSVSMEMIKRKRKFQQKITKSDIHEFTPS
jgi:hypothetical protein